MTQGVFTVAQVKGDELRGQDGDVGGGGTEKKVQIENAYFDKLRARLAAVGVGGGSGGVTAGDTLAELDALEAAEAPKNPGFVVYGDDGHPIT